MHAVGDDLVIPARIVSEQRRNETEAGNDPPQERTDPLDGGPNPPPVSRGSWPPAVG